MKKIIHIAFAAILAGLAISCQKDNTLAEQNDAPVQYSFNIAVNDKAGFDDDASTKGSGPSYKTGWESGDRIFLFFKPTSGNLLTDTHATLTYNEGSWSGSVTGLSSLGKGGNLSAVYVYKLKNSVTPVFSDSKWTIATGNTFYSCRTEVPYTVSGNNEISASLSLEAPADFVQFYVNGMLPVLTCNKVKGWKDVSIGSDLTVSNVTCTGYMNGFANSGEFGVLEYYGRIVNGETSLKDVLCEFSVVRDGKVYEHTATPATAARSFKMNASDGNWTLASGKLPGLFTVGKGKDGKAGTADDVQVRFSQGNLVATIDASGEPTGWKFAEKQYDYIGAKVSNTSIGSKSTSGIAGDVDLFGWSTASTTYGINTSTNKNDYSGDFVDWGKALSASTGIAEDTWRTLSNDEWCYLFNDRTVNAGKGEGKSYQRATINSNAAGGVYGVILYPDNYTETTKESYTSSEWTSLEKADCVFLPAAGYRYGSNVNNVSSNGFYWSSTAPLENEANYVSFSSYNVNPGNLDSFGRPSGYSVRLVSELK